MSCKKENLGSGRCCQIADQNSMDMCEQEIDFLEVPAPTPSRRRRRALPTAFSSTGDYLRSLSVLPPSRASKETSCAELEGVQVASVRSYDSRDRHFLKLQRLRTSPGERFTVRRSLPAPEPANKFCWQPAESQQHNRPDERNDEFDAAAVPFHPRSSLQEHTFVHCPHRPLSPMRGNFLDRPVWLSLRRIAGLECDILHLQIIGNY